MIENTNSTHELSTLIVEMMLIVGNYLC